MYSKLFFLSLILLTFAEENRWLKRGLPDLEWTSWEDAKQGSLQNHKPILTLFTKPWCEDSDALKQRLRDSPRFVELSKHFNLVSVEDIEDIMEEIGFFCTDGDYTPRVYFAHKNGHIDDRITAPGRHEMMKFLYKEVDDLVSKMETIVKDGFPPVHDEL